MTASELIMLHKALTDAVSDAVLAALKGGMTRDDAASILTKVAELLETGDDEE